VNATRTTLHACGVLVALAALCGCRPGSGGMDPQYEDAARGEDFMSPPGLPGFMKVSDTLYRGGQPTAQGFAALKRMGIRTVVCLRILDRDSRLLSGLGLRYRHISVKHWHPEREDVLEFLRIATEPRNQPVLVHCREGVDRTGMMVAAYRMAVQDWPKGRAMAELEEQGFHGANFPIENFLDDLDVVALKRALSEGASLQAEVVP